METIFIRLTEQELIELLQEKKISCREEIECDFCGHQKIVTLLIVKEIELIMSR